jgi:KUP system potassium uptake protein
VTLLGDSVLRSGDASSASHPVGSTQVSQALDSHRGPRSAGSGTRRGHQRPGARYLAVLSLGALGVVYGDIGTSPLYAMREVFAVSGDLEATRMVVFGVASLMFWAMMLVVTLKYLVFVLRADNHGEGGILALTALITPTSQSRRGRVRWAFVAAGLFGTALLYGDGMITPAISVLAAVEGFEVAIPELEAFVVPIAVVILIGLFSIQRRGTATIGAIFGPVMILWFAVLAALGIHSIAFTPGVMKALSPSYGIDLVTSHPGAAFVALGAIFLVVTGSEALYADMGHFGRHAIRIGWFSLVFPALTLNYLGQAALLTRDPAAVENPFFLLAPSWASVPLVVLATLATVIASQALISGAYSLTMQAVQLGYLPRVHIDHTSPREIGQVYIPSVNWLLMVACVGLVVAFRSSTNLAAAYGFAVTATMLITTALLHRVMRDRWGWSRLAAVSLTSLFAVVDAAFFSANVLKIAAGGWFPLVVGILAFALMSTWRRGRALLDSRVEGRDLSIERFIESISINEVTRVPGTAVFMGKAAGRTPQALLVNLRAAGVLHETVVLVSVSVKDQPVVPQSARATVHELGDGFFQVVLHYGFIEAVDVPKALSQIVSSFFGFDPTEAYYFLGKETVLPTDRPGMPIWGERLFALLHRNAGNPVKYFQLPPSRVMEVGTQIEI